MKEALTLFSALLSGAFIHEWTMFLWSQNMPEAIGSFLTALFFLGVAVVLIFWE